MANKEKVCAIIQARMSSKRLKGKVLRHLEGRPVLDWVVKRLRAVNALKKGLIDEIVVATTNNPRDNAIVDWCYKNDVSVFRGSEEDVVSRFHECAVKYRAKYIIRVTADCPFLSPIMLYGLLTQKREHYQALAFNQRRIPGGWDCELFSMEWLKRAYIGAVDREHFTREMRNADQDSKDYGTDFKFDVSLELNTEKDFERCKEYAKYL